MKIVIAYASAGNGHRRAAEAIQSYFKNHHPGVDIILVDIVEYTHRLFAKFYSRGYSFLVVHLKAVWAITYYLTSLRIFAGCFKFFSRLHCQAFRNLLVETQPEIILSTHFFPADVAVSLKQKGLINSRLVTVMTDFSLHTLWVFKNCDDYIVATDYTRDCLLSRGISQEKIKVLGIPVDSGFSAKSDKQRQSKGLTPLETSIEQQRKRKSLTGLSALLVTGAFGFALIEQFVGKLFSKVRLLVVCGNNKKLYKRLKRKDYKGVELFGFTNEMPRLMSAADFVITKPGGLTIAESLAMELPMFFISAIPGQEVENARILERYGCARMVKNPGSLVKVIRELEAYPERLDIMRANIQKIKKPDAAEQICRYLTENECSSSI